MADAQLSRRLEDIDRAGHVDARAGNRVRLAEGHLECGQMNDTCHALVR